MDKDFVSKMEFYLNVRREITDAILKDFGKIGFDESDAYLEIYALDPIFADLLPDLFDVGFEISKISSDFEKKYEELKKERVKTIEKKETKKLKTAVLQQKMVEQNVKSIKKSNKKESKKESKKETQSVLNKNHKRKSKEKE